MPRISTPFIMDIEASGFGPDSYPIEVGLALGDGSRFCSLIVPAEHWTHIRTTNPIESTFATVRHRTKRSKGCLSMKIAHPSATVSIVFIRVAYTCSFTYFGYIIFAIKIRK